MHTQEQSAYSVRRLDVAKDLPGLRQEWMDLLDQIPGASIFLTWDWVKAWVEHMEPGWEPWLLAVRDAEGRLVGVAPLMLVHHRYGPLRVARLAFLGSNYAFRVHQNVAARPADAEAVTEAVLRFLRGEGPAWDVLDLEALAEGSVVQGQLRRGPGYYAEKEPVVCPYQPLPDTWTAYEKEQLSANRRQQLRARRRHLERDYPGQVSFWRVSDEDGLNRGMAELERLHRLRWHGRGQKSSFDIPSFARLHRDFSRAALERDWLRLYLLSVGEQVIAAEYCFLYKGVLFDYQKAFDPSPIWQSYSPGQLVLAYGIQDAIAEGARELDMARGTYDYKFSWTNCERVDTHIGLSRSAPGFIWLAGGNLVARGKAVSHQILPEALRNRINRLLSGGGGAEAERASTSAGVSA